MTDQDADRAAALLKKAIENGSAYAAYLLGKEYLDGTVLQQDIPKALAYLERAAEKENPYAAYLAGKIYLTEDAVKDVSHDRRCRRRQNRLLALSLH